MTHSLSYSVTLTACQSTDHNFRSFTEKKWSNPFFISLLWIWLLCPIFVCNLADALSKCRLHWIRTDNWFLGGIFLKWYSTNIKDLIQHLSGSHSTPPKPHAALSVNHLAFCLRWSGKLCVITDSTRLNRSKLALRGQMQMKGPLLLPLVSTNTGGMFAAPDWCSWRWEE